MASSMLAVGGEVLFVNGQSGYSIVLPSSATPTEKFAAKELQTILKKSGNVTLPIVTSAGKNGSNIFIKTVPNGKKLEVRDEITIKYDNGDLILQGNKGYCALFAVYRFAERQLGFRWLYPGDAGEFFTPRNKFVLTPSVSEVFIPKIRYRHMHITDHPKGMDIDSEMWMLRNYHNIGLRTKSLIEKVDVPRFFVSHFGGLRRKHAKLFKDHPEYFSLINGERTVNGWGGCWTNPGYIDFFAEEVCKSIEANKWDMVYIIAPDMTVRCECAPCNAEKSIPDRWLNLFRIVYGKVKARYPDVKLGTLAYHEYRELPRGDIKFADLPPNFCFSNHCYIHKLGDKNCSYQAKALKLVDDWRKKYGDIAFYNYENDIFLQFASYVPLMNILPDRMRYFAEVDPYFVLTEFCHTARWARDRKLQLDVRHVNLYRLNNYIFITMLHSPQVDSDKLVRDFCNTVYGPAGEVMYRYHREMAEAWESMNAHLVWYFHNAGPVSRMLLNDERIARINGYFAEAEKLVKSKPEYARHIKDVAIDRINFDLWVEYYKANSTAVAEFPLGLGKENAFNFTMKNRATYSRVDKRSFKLNTKGSIARDANFLYVHVDCYMEPGDVLRKGEKMRDHGDIWKDDTVEILIRTDQQSDYFHLAANPAGGIYDARVSDTSWNPVWSVKTDIKNGFWSVDFTIPFNELGYDGNPEGRSWQIGVMRHTSGDKTAGFPFPVFGQITATAKITFDAKASQDKTITLILPEKPNKMNYIPDLTAAGWTIKRESFKEGREKRSTEKEVLMLTPATNKEAPLQFYRTRIDSALDNGSLVIFNDHSWTGWQYLFGKEFPREYFRFKEVNPDRKFYWADSKSTAEEAAKWQKLIRSSCHSAYIPAEGWHILGNLKLKNGQFAPVMMYKRHRNGMVVLLLGMDLIKKGHVGEFIEFLVKRWKTEEAQLVQKARESGKVITVIQSEKPIRNDPVGKLLKAGWWVDRESCKLVWNKRSTGKEVIMLQPPPIKEAPLFFYRSRIDSALDNGSLVIFNDHSWTGWQYLFGKEFPKAYHRYEETEPDKNFYWVDSKSSAKEAKKWQDTIKKSCHSAYTVTPGWHVLANLKLKNGQYAPVMMYKKHRKGMVVLLLGMDLVKDQIPEFTEFLIRRWQQECK